MAFGQEMNTRRPVSRSDRSLIVALASACVLASCAGSATEEAAPDSATPAAPQSEPQSLLTGTVRTRDGAPVPSATVTGKELAPNSHDLMTGRTCGSSTDPAGRFSLDCAAGRYVVEVSADGYATSRRVLDSQSEHPAPKSFVLQPVVPLRGTVVDQQDNAVAGIDIVVADGSRRQRGLTDSDGRFAFENVAPGNVQVETSSGAVYGIASTVASPTHSSDLKLVVSAARPVAGKVVDSSAASKGIAGVQVVLASANSGVSFAAAAPTQNDGSFHTSAIPPGLYRVVTVGPLGIEIPNRLGSVVVDGAPTITIPTPQLESLRVNVPPSEGTTLTLRWRSDDDATYRQLGGGYLPAGTDSFEFPAVPKGRVLVEAVTRRGLAGTASVTVDASPAEVSIDMRPARELRGVVTSDGSPVSGGKVVLARGLTREAQPEMVAYDFRILETGEDGTFAARGLIGGVYSVTAYDGSSQRPPSSLPDPKDPTLPLFVSSTDDPSAHLNVDLAPCTSKIEGTVLTARGTPAAAVRVELIPEEVRSGFRNSAVTDAAGAFSLQTCEPTRALYAMDPATGDAGFWMPTSGTPTVVHLQRGTTVTGKIAGMTDVDALVSLEVTGLSVARHQYAFRGDSFEVGPLPTGTYAYALTTTTGYGEGTLTIGDSAVPGPTVDLIPWSRVSGRVVSGNGLPQRGIRVVIDLAPGQRQAPDSLFPHEIAQTTTDDDGRFAFERMVRGKGTLVLWSEEPLLHDSPARTRNRFGAFASAEAYLPVSTRGNADVEIGEVVVITDERSGQ